MAISTCSARAACVLNTINPLPEAGPHASDPGTAEPPADAAADESPTDGTAQPASDAPAELTALPAPNDRSLAVQAQLRRVEQEIGAQNRAAAVSAISHIP